MLAEDCERLDAQASRTWTRTSLRLRASIAAARVRTSAGRTRRVAFLARSDTLSSMKVRGRPLDDTPPLQKRAARPAAAEVRRERTPARALGKREGARCVPPLRVNCRVGSLFVRRYVQVSVTGLVSGSDAVQWKIRVGNGW
jgi:hypothetical protein